MIKLLRRLSAPLATLAVILFLELLAAENIIPPTERLLGFLKVMLADFGILIVGPLAFFENIFGLNVYFPGSIIILTTMALSTGDPRKGFLICIIYLGFAILAYHVDYYIGATILRKKNLQNESLKPTMSLWVRFLSTFWHPHLAALTCVHIGTEGWKYFQIIKYIIVASLLWTTFWGLIMYNLKLLSGPNINLKYLAYIYIFGWLVITIYQHNRTIKSSKIEL